jgi:hypothetical protein
MSESEMIFAGISKGIRAMMNGGRPDLSALEDEMKYRLLFFVVLVAVAVAATIRFSVAAGRPKNQLKSGEGFGKHYALRWVKRQRRSDAALCSS